MANDKFTDNSIVTESMKFVDLPFDDSSVNYPKDIIMRLDELSIDIPNNVIGLHRLNIDDICSIKASLTHQKVCIDSIVNECLLTKDLNSIDCYFRPANNYSDELHCIVNRVAEIFYQTWLKEYDYENIFLSFLDCKNRNGDNYINLMSYIIADLIDSEGNVNYIDMIKLCFSEAIKENNESSYSICKALGYVLFEQSYNSFNAANDILCKIKNYNSVRLSKASSRPKSRDYDEIVSIIKQTIEKYNDASVSSLIEKICCYYDSKQRKPPAKNTIRSWISDLGYKPEGKPTNKYHLVVSKEKS